MYCWSFLGLFMLYISTRGRLPRPGRALDSASVGIYIPFVVFLTRSPHALWSQLYTQVGDKVLMGRVEAYSCESTQTDERDRRLMCCGIQCVVGRASRGMVD